MNRPTLVNTMDESMPLSSELVLLARRYKFEWRTIPAEEENESPIGWYALDIESKYLGAIEISFDEQWFTVVSRQDKTEIHSCKHEGYKDVKKRIIYFKDV